VRGIRIWRQPGHRHKRIKTQVRVNNGETLVLGGIFDGVRARAW
jgi:type IV pilus assembly protein PilQ